MKLFIKRDQKAQTGLLGGHKGILFQLSYRLELTPQEKDLVSRYKAESFVLCTYTNSDGTKAPDLTVNKIMNGGTDDAKDIDILLSNEKAIKDACASFKVLLEVMETFGGEEVIDY